MTETILVTRLLKISNINYLNLLNCITIASETLFLNLMIMSELLFVKKLMSLTRTLFESLGLENFQIKKYQQGNINVSMLA
jgi:hypothetical protein